MGFECNTNYTNNYKGDNHAKAWGVINSGILNEDYVDAFRYFYPNDKSYTYRWDCDKTKKARLDYVLVTPNLTDKSMDIEHKFTISSDHESIIIELAMNVEKQGKGIFRAPPSIQNDPFT